MYLMSAMGDRNIRAIPDECVDLINDVSQFEVGVAWWQFEFENEAIDFVDANCYSKSFLYSVLQQTFRV